MAETFNLLGSYLEQSYDRYSFFSTVVFPNEQLKLSDYYQPLTLIDPTGTLDPTLVRNFPTQLVESCKDLMIIDTAGMGKSTLIKQLFLTSIDNTSYIPVLVELRRLNTSNSLEAYISQQVKLSSHLVNQKVIHTLLEKGLFIILLDGFDEVLPDSRNAIISQIQDLKQWANECKFLITSRDLPELGSFADFKRLSIKPLQPYEAFSLIRKYGRGVDLGEQLITEIEGGHLQTVSPFLGNPLLVSLLYKCYEYKQQVPLNRTVFYRQVYDSLFEAHDLRKPGGPLKRPRKTGLDTKGFETLTRTFAFITYQAGKSEYTVDEFMAWVSKASELQPDYRVTPHDYLSDLTVQVPLFTADGNNYRWVHRSLQEYFCALAIYHDASFGPHRVLPSIYRSPRLGSHLNLLTLYAELDTKGFRRYFLKQLLSDITGYLDKAAEYIPGVLSNDQRERRMLMFDRYAVIVKVSDQELPVWRNEIQDSQQHNSFFHSVIVRCNEAIASLDPDFPRKAQGWGCAMTNPTVIYSDGPFCNLLRVHGFGLTLNISRTHRHPTNEALESLMSDLPPGVYPISERPTDALNEPQRFPIVNSILMSQQNLIDEALVRSLLSEIVSEESRDDEYPLSF